MSYWNYRVIEFVEPTGQPWRQIHEVHYDDVGRPVAYTENAAAVVGDSNDELRECLNKMLCALDRTVLVERDFQSASQETDDEPIDISELKPAYEVPGDVTSPIVGYDANGSEVVEKPAVPPGHFWRGDINRFYCKNCGGHYDQHERTADAVLCPSQNRRTAQ